MQKATTLIGIFIAVNIFLATYSNKWIQQLVVTSIQDESFQTAVNSTSALSTNTVTQIDNTVHRNAGETISFHARRSDVMAQTHQCLKSMPMPGRDHGPLNLMLFEDDVLRGKSCSSETGEWICRDCGLDCQFDSWDNCTTLRLRKPRCKQNVMRSWNDPSMNQMSFDSYASFQPSRRKISQQFENPRIPERELEQVDCRGVTDERCFNLSKCEESVLTVYAYPETFAFRNLQRVVQRNPSTIKVVDNAQDACLIVVSCDYFRTYKDLYFHPNWNEGRNHFIWSSYRCFHDHQDYILTKNLNFQRAALSTPNLMDLNLRHRYDIPIPYFRPAMNEELTLNASKIEHLDLHRPRRFQLFFKALFQRMQMFWQHHRWFPLQYWDRSGTVVVDVMCGLVKGQYKIPPEDFVDYMLNTTFAFCPGGISPGSFRFNEALALQAIPVVTADFAAPFEPDVDWSDCLVRVSVARIVDLPRLLQETYSEDDIRNRQKRCQELFHETIGWIKSGEVWRIDHGQQAFEMAMKVWAIRVKTAFAAQRVANEVMQSTVVNGITS